MKTFTRLLPTKECINEFYWICRKVDSYTAEQLELIKSQWLNDTDDYKKFCTVKGMYEQINSFNAPTGFIYYISFVETPNTFKSKIEKYVFTVEEKTFKLFMDVPNVDDYVYYRDEHNQGIFSLKARYVDN